MAVIRKLWNTKRRLRILAAIFGVSLIYLLPFMALPGFAAIYLQITGIDGESVNKSHPKWIEVDSFQFGAGRPVSQGGGGTTVGAPQVSEVTVSKRMDRSSPLLFNETVLGNQPRTATFHFTKTIGTGSEATYYEVTLSDVLVSGFSQSGGSEVPSESVSLNFGKIEMKYTQYDSKGGITGTTTATYDVAAGTKF